MHSVLRVFYSITASVASALPPKADIVPLRSIIDRRVARRKVERTAQALGHGFVLDCTNDRREYGPASATRDQLGDHAANAQIARLCCRHDRRQG
jgi:hypothetical protein